MVARSILAAWVAGSVAFIAQTASAQPLPRADFHLGNAIAYCEREPQECRLPPGDARPEPIAAVLPVLDQVNREVNAAISFRLDREQYGASDYWTVPQAGEGDCEDYALAKRQLLIDRGIDPRNLRITLVRFAENGKQINHALLGVVTDRGMRYLDMNSDQVGDGLASAIRFGYRFEAMQSANDFTVYQPIGDPVLTSAMAKR